MKMTVMPEDKPRPPYWLGLFGLIPGVGAVMGLALFVLGIIHYKNWKVIVIGLVDILLTLLAIMVLVIYIFRWAWDEARVPIAQSALTYTARQLEFYKFEKGCYPGSLWDLHRFDHSVQVMDPSQRGIFNMREFEYHPSGDHYTLFSVGMDGLAHTSDDIFPVIPADTGRVHYGWIKE
jgi:hypothetical protein